MSKDTKVKEPTKPKTSKITPQGKFSKNLVHARIMVINGIIYLEKWGFSYLDFPCGMCKKNDDVVFMRHKPLNLVTRSCEYCGFTEIVQPINRDNNAELAYKISTRVLTLQEAWKYVEEFGQKKFPPMGLPKAGKRRRTRTIPKEFQE